MGKDIKKEKKGLRVTFDGRLKLEVHGSKVTGKDSIRHNSPIRKKAICYKPLPALAENEMRR